MYFRVVDGSIKKGDKIRFMASGKVIKTNLNSFQQTTVFCYGYNGFFFFGKKPSIAL